MRTNDYLEAVKRARNIKSDAKLADALEVTGASISALRNGKTHMGDETALKVAEILGIEPYEVLADCHAERARNPEAAKAWRALAERMRNPKSAALMLQLCVMSNAQRAASAARKLLAALANANNSTHHAHA